MSDVTPGLNATGQGDPHTAAQLLPLVYAELRKLATHKLFQEAPGQTLQPTALVHEVYLRLAGKGGETQQWDNRGHFFAAAAEAMRRILVENARRKQSQKRGGGLHRQDVAVVQPAAPEPDEELLALDEALDHLAAHDPVKAQLVQLRYFAGLTIAEAAELLKISPATAKRSWVYARAWLYDQMAAGASPSPRLP